MIKSKYSKEEITKFLCNKYNEQINLIPVVEGQESQVYSFSYNDRDYICRINPTIEGFKKDDYSYKNFNSKSIPVPKIIEYGNFNDTHFFCISEKAKGITLEDSSEKTVDTLLPDITSVWMAISEIDISNTNGYGIFSSENGNAPYSSWREYLLSIFDEKKYDWKKLNEIQEVDSKLVNDIKKEFLELLEYCPEDRKLRHGDFGSNNMLVDPTIPIITGVIDWDNASYGDPFYDTNGFWRTWLMCMEKTSVYWEQKYSHIPNYYERIRCYQLHTGLGEIYENALDGDFETLNWCQERCRQILISDKINIVQAKEEGDFQNERRNKTIS